MTLFSVQDGVTKFQPAMCDVWSCPACGVRKAAWFRGELLEAIPAHHLDYFWTQTWRTGNSSAAESYELVSKAWNICRTGLKQDLGSFSYVKVTEATKRGYAHQHLLISLPISEEELSRRWRNATDGSWVVDVSSVYSEKAANYLSKYCAKEAPMRAQLMPEGFRGHVYSKSRDIRFRDLRSSSEESWEVLNKPWKEVVDSIEKRGVLISQKTTGKPAMTVDGAYLSRKWFEDEQ